MRCCRPFVSGRAAYPCGQCVPCLKYRARVWSHRIILESYCHAVNSFVTLTYQDCYQRKQLQPGDTTAWLKRLRRRVEPKKLRYYLVGEYGDRTLRPHYHVALFGYPSCFGRYPVVGECQCPSCLGVRETWGFGHVSVLPLETKSAQYIAGYVTKKQMLVSSGRLSGLRPPFQRMSLKPGIGADAMWDVASATMLWSQRAGSALRHGATPRPLGRYLRSKLLDYTGQEKEAYVDQLLPLVRAFAFANRRSVASVYAEVNGTEIVPQFRGTL